MQIHQTAPTMLLFLALVLLVGHAIQNHGIEINRNVAALCQHISDENNSSENNSSGTRIQLNLSSVRLIWVSCR